MGGGPTIVKPDTRLRVAPNERRADPLGDRPFALPHRSRRARSGSTASYSVFLRSSRHGSTKLSLAKPPRASVAAASDRNFWGLYLGSPHAAHAHSIWRVLHVSTRSGPRRGLAGIIGRVRGARSPGPDVRGLRGALTFRREPAGRTGARHPDHRTRGQWTATSWNCSPSAESSLRCTGSRRPRPSGPDCAEFRSSSC